MSHAQANRDDDDRRPARRRNIAGWALTLGLVAILAACGSSDDTSDGGQAGDTDASGAALDVVASFYPLQFVTEQVGGTAVAVSNLTPAGAEPHDLELTASDTASLQDADLVVFLHGFSPALDDGIDGVGANGFDVSASADLSLTAADDHADEHADEADDEHADEADDGIDPHFWLDPLRLADVGDAIAAELSALLPDEAATFTQNAVDLRIELEALDAEFTAALADCTNSELVTSHQAFGYLAQRYGLTQVGISGLSPDEEPTPAQLAEVTDFVAANDVTTIYYETLVDPGVAETVAAETGASTAVLDPLEGLSADTATGTDAADYFSVMRANLVTLQAGQGCS